MKGKCLISLTQEDRAVITTQEIAAEDDEDYSAGASVTGVEIAEDSDDDMVGPAPATVLVKAPEPVVVKVPVAEPVVVATPAPEKKKMVVKKKVVKDGE